MLVANTNSGNLTAVARDWSYLPPHAHRMGIEALLQTALFAGIPRCMNALSAVYQVCVGGRCAAKHVADQPAAQTGVCRDAIDWKEQDAIALRNVTSAPNMYGAAAVVDPARGSDTLKYWCITGFSSAELT